MSVPQLQERPTPREDDEEESILPLSGEYSSMKHVMPKTKISHAILHENTSQERHLAMALQRLNHNQERTGNTYALSMKHFSDKQKLKHNKWKREDEVRTLGMNLPNIRKLNEGKRVDSAQTIYRSPTYLDEGIEKSLRREKTLILPYMSVSREHIKYIAHRQSTFITRLPTIINIDENKLQKYKRFCGSSINDNGTAIRDRRFKKLTKVLTPVGGTKKNPLHFLTADVTTDEETTADEEASIVEEQRLFTRSKCKSNLHRRPRRISQNQLSLSVKGEAPNIKCRPVLANPAKSASKRRESNDKETHLVQNSELKSKSWSNINESPGQLEDERPNFIRAGTDLMLNAI